MTEVEIMQDPGEPEAKRMKQGTVIIQLQVGFDSIRHYLEQNYRMNLEINVEIRSKFRKM